MGTSPFSPSEMRTRSGLRPVSVILFFIIALFSVVGIVYGLGFVPSPDWEVYRWLLVGVHSMLFALALAGGIIVLKSTSFRAFNDVWVMLFLCYLFGVINYFVKWVDLQWAPIGVQFAALVLLIIILFCVNRAHSHTETWT